MKLFFSLFLLSALSLFANPVNKTYFYISTNDAAVSASIALCSLDSNTGAIELVKSFEGATAPSYLSMNSDHTRLYSVFEGCEGSVAAWSVDPSTYELTLMNALSSGGVHPCHLSLNEAGDVLFVANYSSGTLGVLRMDEQGALGSLLQQIKHEGSGPNAERQEASHMHFVQSVPGGNLVLATDLGSDKVMIYQFNQDECTLLSNPNQACLRIDPGSGPRHLAFHPTQPWVFLLNELNGTVDTLYFEGETGRLQFHSRIELLPSDFAGFNKSAAIRVHPSGQFVYGSNRGDLNSITVFKVLPDGSLETVAVHSDRIGWPRDFAIDPSGKFLLVGCREDDEVRVFNIDPETGALENTGAVVSFQKPVCILFPK